MQNWKRNITIFLTGQGITLFGSMLVHYAVQWHITLKSQSGVAMMMLSLAAAVPMFLVSPFAGVWADRYNKKLLINLADGAIAAVTLFMAVIFSLGFEVVMMLLVCVAARGLAQGIQMPAVNSLLPELTPPEHLTRVNGINSTIQSVAMFTAPVAGGALITFMPIQTALYIDVVTAAVGISMLVFFVKTPKRVVKQEQKSALGDMKEGFGYILTHAFVKRLILISTLFNLLITPAAVLTPLQTIRKFGEQPWRLVAIELAFFIGMSMGGILMGTWGGFRNKSYTMALSTAFAGASICGLGLVGNFSVYLVCMGLMGIVMSAFNAPMMAVLQTKVVPEFMGRVFAVLTMVSSIMMPLGMTVWGPLGDAVPIDWLLIVSGVGILAIGSIFIASKTMREAGISEVRNESESV